MKCCICNKEFKNLKALICHVNGIHDMKNKEYYDKFIKTDKEGCCLCCGGETTFRGSGVGYLECCSKKCDAEYKKNNDLTTKYWLGKKQPEELVRRRVKNTNQESKENKRIETMLDRYGYSNPGQSEEAREINSKFQKGSSKPRSDEHQDKIIESKIKNGTTKHTEETKHKISLSLMGDNNPFRRYLANGGNLPKTSGGISGYYKGIYFRSSLELSFIHFYIEKYSIQSAENNKFKVEYTNTEGNKKYYYPDFFIEEIDTIFELKPKSLLKYNSNPEKYEAAKIKFKNYKLLTEEDIPYMKKEDIYKLINDGIVLLDERAYKKLERYKK